MFYGYEYFPAPPSIYFQGTQAELAKKLKATGLHVISGSNGSYVLGGKSSGTIFEYADDSRQQVLRTAIPSKDMMRIRYGKERITEKDYQRLATDLNNGSIVFDSLLRYGS